MFFWLKGVEARLIICFRACLARESEGGACTWLWVWSIMGEKRVTVCLKQTCPDSQHIQITVVFKQHKRFKSWFVFFCIRCSTFQSPQSSGAHKRIETPAAGRLICISMWESSSSSSRRLQLASRPHKEPTIQVGRRIFSPLQFVTVSILLEDGDK